MIIFVFLQFTQLHVFRSDKKWSYDSIIVQDLGQFGGVKAAVHHFGHLLGAYHDGDETSSDCCSGDGYIMSKTKYNKVNLKDHRLSLPNSSYWSPCSVKAIEKFVSTAICLFNEPELEEHPLFDWQDLVGDIQGGAPSLTHQCSPYSSFTVACGDNPCQYLECDTKDYTSVSDTSSRVCAIQEKNYAMEGTSCGEEKFCFQGTCKKGNNFYYVTDIFFITCQSLEKFLKHC